MPWQQRQSAAPDLCDQGYGSSKDGIVTLCMALVRPHLDTTSSFGTWQMKDVDKQEGAKERALRVVGMEHMPHEERLGELGMGQPGGRMALGHPTAPSTSEVS